MKGKMLCAICIPTKNEEENIERLVREIISLSVNGKTIKIILINDPSKDSTYEKELKLEKEHKGKVFVIRNSRKPGLGSSYATGFDFAVKKLKAEIILTMDADFSHNPKDIPALLKALDDSDIAIGSRYIKGGKIIGWSAFRIITSALANLIGRKATGGKIKDVTSGLRAYRSIALGKIRYDSGIRGYAFLLSVLCEAGKKGFRISEIPINFTNRKKGKSKLKQKDILEFLVLALKEISLRAFQPKKKQQL
ncbi:MAG: glycosyltransferase [Candidatus Woesearchaeota archaeon]|nr:glycosyltransferase [Candidatus Woesearchaeota archaeon]